MFLQILVLLAASGSAVLGDEEVLKNLTTVTWAHAVNNKTFLQAALASDVQMLEADIVLGQLIGKEGPPIPVMAHPPATTSDLSLGDFLSIVAQHNKGIAKEKQKGVKLDFKSIEAFEKAQDLIARFSKPEDSHARTTDAPCSPCSRRDFSAAKSPEMSTQNDSVTFPLWLNADILPGPVAATTKPLDPEKFIKLASNHPRAVLSVGWTTRYGGNITEGEYTRQQIGTMLRMVNALKVNQTITFPVRAGLASNSQPVILDLLRETRALGSSVTVWSAEGDAVAVERLRALILTVGLEHTYLDVPAELAARLQLPAPPATRTHN
ncbi:protein FAM151A isoform X1 [Cydia amplana]|uniref:protein FAM151A isoform X1 n=1 Tax=Cydia amplana TaxID=1869771 RepID=UPI002FE69546